LRSTQHNITAKDFGPNFNWGVAIAAAQNEGATNIDGKGVSIWDSFARNSNKIKGGDKLNVACDFYHRYKDDLLLVKALGFSVSVSQFPGPEFYPMVQAKSIKKELIFTIR
jgi:beta-glucosidase